MSLLLQGSPSTQHGELAVMICSTKAFLSIPRGGSTSTCAIHINGKAIIFYPSQIMCSSLSSRHYDRSSFGGAPATHFGGSFSLFFGSGIRGTYCLSFGDRVPSCEVAAESTPEAASLCEAVALVPEWLVVLGVILPSAGLPYDSTAAQCLSKLGLLLPNHPQPLRAVANPSRKIDRKSTTDVTVMSHTNCTFSISQNSTSLACHCERMLDSGECRLLLHTSLFFLSSGAGGRGRCLLGGGEPRARRS